MAHDCASPCPSIWKARNQRRHCAIMDANASIHAKLDQIMSKVTTTDPVLAPPGLSMSMDVKSAKSHVADEQELQTQSLKDQISEYKSVVMNMTSKQQTLEQELITAVDRINTLERIFIFVDLDQVTHAIQTVREKSSAKPEHDQSPLENMPEPETETSPVKPDTKPDTDEMHTITKCNFDIFSDAEADEHHNEIEKLDKLAESIRSQIQELRARYDADRASSKSLLLSLTALAIRSEYFEVINRTFSTVFADSAALPKTKMSRSKFEAQYDPMHKSGVWSQLCDLYTRGTKDPTASSDQFLRAAYVAYKLWEDR